MTSPDLSGTTHHTAAPGRPRAVRRWYRHRWNTPLSWELILRVTPLLPPPLLLPLHHATSLLCFVCMPRERAAARRNLRRVTGAAGLANLWLAYRLFYNFSRFMVGYAEMLREDPGRLEDRLLGTGPADRIIRSALGEGRGAIILTIHLGHWDLGLRLLSRFGVPVHVVMVTQEPARVARFADRARALPHLRIHTMGDAPLLAVELMAALRRGELVAIQADRAVGHNVMPTPLFGAEAPLPVGPVRLAMATSAPVVPAFVVLERGRRYRLVTLEPLRFDRVGGDGARAAVQQAMLRVARTIESVVARYPDQWFNFFDVWPASRGEPRDV